MHQSEASRTLPLVANAHFDPAIDLLSLINGVTVVIHNMRQIPANMIG